MINQASFPSKLLWQIPFSNLIVIIYIPWRFKYKPIPWSTNAHGCLYLRPSCMFGPLNVLLFIWHSHYLNKQYSFMIKYRAHYSKKCLRPVWEFGSFRWVLHCHRHIYMYVYVSQIWTFDFLWQNEYCSCKLCWYKYVSKLMLSSWLT